MEKVEVLRRMKSEGLIPVVRVSNSQEAIEVGAALREGGATLIEITLTVEGALVAIRDLCQRYPGEVIVGAGTVLDVEAGKAALDAGAQFLVSPALNVDLIRLAHDSEVVVIPGAMTPTEILTAWKSGADLVKVFPVAQLGGPDYIRSIRGPFPGIPLVPTGGVNVRNAGSFIRAGAAVLGVGGELVDRKAVAEKAFPVISDHVRALLKAIREARQDG